jgi:hypothetical protein
LLGPYSRVSDNLVRVRNLVADPPSEFLGRAGRRLGADIRQRLAYR